MKPSLPIHETYVQSGPAPYAICRTCGWEGPPRTTHADAATDAGEHGEPIDQPWLEHQDEHIPDEEEG